MVPVHVRHQDVIGLRAMPGRASRARSRRTRERREPRSQSRYSGPPVSIWTQEELPPKVADSAKLSSARRRPPPSRRVEAAVRRLDQRGNHLLAHAPPRAAWAAIRAFPRRSLACDLRSGGVVAASAGGSSLRDRLAHRLEAGKHQVESADREDLLTIGCIAATASVHPPGGAGLRGDHQRSQAGAADVLDATGRAPDDPALRRSAAGAGPAPSGHRRPSSGPDGP